MIIEPKYEELKRNNQVIGAIITWKDLKNVDEAYWAEAIGYRRSVVVSGDLNGGECLIEGSNDQQNVGSLQQSLGRSIKIKASGEYVEICEISRFIRPIISGNIANLTVSIMVIL